MPQRLRIRLVLAGLALTVAACAGSTSTASMTPAATPVTTSASTPGEAATSATPAATPTAPGNTTDAYPLLAGYQGHFTGSWDNTTFATTGSMTWDITADPSARTVDITVDVGGRFFGGPGGPPESIKLTHLADGVIKGTSSAFGDVSGTITPGGALSIALTNIPGGTISNVEIRGTFTGSNTISMTYTVDFVAGSGAASGTVKLNRA